MSPPLIELTTQSGSEPVRAKVAPVRSRRSDRVRAGVAAVLPFTVLLIAGIVILLLPADLGAQARAAIFAFLIAVVLWTTTSLPTAWVALAAVLVLVAGGGAEQQVLFDSLASDVVWLMIGAFVLGAAVQQTGLATRLTGLVARGGADVGRVMWRTSWLLLPLSLLIPSTSGRAAVMLPVFRSVTAAADDPKITRAYSLLIPTVILTSTICTLVGAGSHLIANDLLAQVGVEPISFGRWLLYGAPFGVVASAIATAVILAMFLRPEQRRRRLEVPPPARTAFSEGELKTVCVTVAMVAAWTTESWHGVEIATVAVLGAAALTMPRFGVLTWKQAVSSVTWNLIIFVGAALVLGQALIETGAARWVIDGLFTVTGVGETDSAVIVLLLVALITLTSHLYMTSHAARAAALVPAMLLLGETLGYQPAALMFIATVGMDFCLTFPVSSKALLLYAEVGEDSFTPPDLLRLSAVMLLVHMALMVIFYFGYWQHVGLALR